MNFFRFVAEDVRRWLAVLGVAKLEDLIGRTDLLALAEAQTPRQRGLDLAPLLAAADGRGDAARHCTETRNRPRDTGVLATRMLDEMRAAIHAGAGGEFSYPVRNSDRSLGARLSGEIARVHGNHGMADVPLTVRLQGNVGQSFGAWNAGGLHLHLTGDANDYVGKGMAGGRIVLQPPAGSRFVPRDTPIMGNTCLYGATGGELYAAGRAGERFAVRNSGATAVVEGVGDHGCEYMTGGVVAVLGRTGLNFGAGLTGGLAYVLDLDRDFVDRYNHELIDVLRITPEGMEHHRHHLRALLRCHVEHTGSAWGRAAAGGIPRRRRPLLAGQAQGRLAGTAGRRAEARGMSQSLHVHQISPLPCLAGEGWGGVCSRSEVPPPPGLPLQAGGGEVRGPLQAGG